MSQLARQLEVREPLRKQRNNPSTMPTTSPRKMITKGEKVLWSIGIFVILLLSILVVSKQASIYLVNHQISSIESNIESVTKNNMNLSVEKTKLMDPKRIMNYAEKHGYTLNIDNVKVIK